MKTFFAVLGYATTITTVLGVLFGFQSIVDLPLLWQIISVILLFSLAILTMILIKKEDKKRVAENEILINEINKNKAYVLAIPKISKAISVFVNGYKTNTFLSNLKKLEDEIATIFSEIKGVPCCVTVKYFEANGTMCTKRSLINGKDRPDRGKLMDNKKKYPTLKSFLKANTDFSVLFEKLQLNKPRNVYFFSNDLINYIDYQNSLLEEDGYYRKVMKRGGSDAPREIKETLWPLEYKSTIVVPLTLMAERDEEELLETDVEPKLAGTLCIDSKEVEIFDELVDVGLLQSISETIFLYMNLNKRKRKTTAKP